jgi:hypothetical protein
MRSTIEGAMMVNHFDIAREWVRLVIDAGKPSHEGLIELRRMFPGATRADLKRAFRIGIERADLVEEERQERARAFAERWYAGADLVDTEIKLALQLQETAAELGDNVPQARQIE